MVCITDIELMRELLKEENNELKKLLDAFINLRNGLMEKISVNEINGFLLIIEKKANNFKKVESSRVQIMNQLIEKNGIDNNLESIIDFFSENNVEVAILLSDLINTLKDLKDEISLLNDLISFHSNLNNFIYKIINPESIINVNTYTNKGESKTQDLTNKGWRG
ncbi:hypothetical protein [Petrotoga sp. 9PW.55.5.1]|uniref:hypothetical protein n=1 Tax=Petrotoga sp. 9PW.55.5.1 TaxID=1308979 RepID=UPI0011BD07B1|nr:hypothetical protein [Petrotoga sp. 9PW.55.5.1]